jgi:hypothetical protein
MKKTAPWVLLCSLLTGCGLQFTYNQLDWLGRWYVNGYVSLNSPQQAEFKQRWNGHLNWHRQTQLRRYAELLKTFKVAVNTDLTMDHVVASASQVERFFRSTARQIAPDLTYFATQLDDEQSLELLDSLARKNRKWAKKYVTPAADKRARRRIADTTGRIEDWTGRLNRSQRSRIHQWNSQLAPITDQMLAQRIRWREVLEHYFDNRNQPVSSRYLSTNSPTSLADLIVNPESLWTDEYRAAIEHNKQASILLVYDLFSQLTDRQMKHLNRKLDNTIEDLEQLSTDNDSLLTQNEPLER